jgi:hypothetical protein
MASAEIWRTTLNWFGIGHSFERMLSMRMRVTLIVVSLGLFVPLSPAADSTLAQWPQFRGANCAGVGAPDARPPVKIGPSENLLWKVEVPWSPGSPACLGRPDILNTFNDSQLETRSYDRATANCAGQKE